MLTPAFILATKSLGSPDSAAAVLEATGGSFLPSELGKMEPRKRYRAARTMPRPSTTTSEDGEAIRSELCRILEECESPGTRMSVKN